jgi:glycine cleavage system transcriptional repressor
MLRIAMRHLGLSAVGRDRPGIVAAITRVLLEYGVNVEDSQMTILRGHFTMMLILAVPPDVEIPPLAEALRVAGEGLELEALSIAALDETDPADEPVPSHIVTVYGLDHPGIVNAVSEALAERSITITDLQTRVVGEESAPIYALMMEVALPEGLAAEVEAALSAAGGEQGVEVTVRPLESDTL